MVKYLSFRYYLFLFLKRRSYIYFVRYFKRSMVGVGGQVLVEIILMWSCYCLSLTIPHKCPLIIAL